MRIFKGLTPSSDEETLLNAVRNMASELYRIPAPRSLCEIQIDEEDYQWLRQWARRLTGWRVQRWLDGISSRQIALNVREWNLTYSEAFGCMFLLIASEAARREANEGQVWTQSANSFRDPPKGSCSLRGTPGSRSRTLWRRPLGSCAFDTSMAGRVHRNTTSEFISSLDSPERVWRACLTGSRDRGCRNLFSTSQAVLSEARLLLNSGTR